MHRLGLFQAKSHIKFISRIEAYTFTLHYLQVLSDSIHDVAINHCMEAIKIAIENHELNTKVVCEHLKQLSAQLQSKKAEKVIYKLIKAILDNKYKQTKDEKFLNTLGRRFESEISVVLLTQPTTAMMSVVGKISQAIIKAIDKVLKSGSDFEKNILERLPDSITIGRKECFGAFKKKPSFEQIKETLARNAPDSLDRIMLIHYKFARHVLRKIAIKLPSRHPRGEYANLIKQNYGSYQRFSHIASKSIEETQFNVKLQECYEARAFISNEIISHSPLYTNDVNRGRVSSLFTYWTDTVGLMLSNEYVDIVGLPVKKYDWVRECYVGRANLNSPTVLDAIENDGVYVTGPSGLTSLYLGLMELLGNFKTTDLKQHYLACIMAYVVSTGFHSIHEILGPAEYALKLIPGYHIQVPDVDFKIRAKPANYHQYFKILMQIDGDFIKLRNQAWDKYLNYFKQIYLHRSDVMSRLKLKHIYKNSDLHCPVNSARPLG